MKTEFKVGDTVEIAEGDYCHNKGDRYIVTEIRKEKRYQVRLDSSDNPIDNLMDTGSLKLIKRKQMKKEDLKTGMRVEDRTGDVFMVMLDTSNGDRFIDGAYDWDLNSFTKDLEWDCDGEKDDTCDIVKIFDMPDLCDGFVLSKYKGELLWSREDSVKEYTMEEAIKLVGHEFKIKK